MRYTQLSIMGHTVTLEQYSAIGTREERLRFRDIFITRLSVAIRDTQALLDKIHADAWKAFRAEVAGVPEELPTHFTKTGKPDRRYGGRPNPAYYKPAQVRDQVIKDLASRVPPVEATFRWPYQFEEVFNAWEQTVETPMERFRRLLSGMDWYSHYSDDYRVWSAGEERSAQVRSLVQQLGAEAQLEYNRACPWLNEDGSRKSEAA